MRTFTLWVVIVVTFGLIASPASITRAVTFGGAPNQQAAPAVERDAVLQALRKAVEFYRSRVATEGGYHYYYAEDLSYGRSEHGEGPTQVEVQREATPVVGLAYLSAYEVTGDRYYLEAARETAHALVKGQLCSGGWDYIIEFDPVKRQRLPYRTERKCDGANRAQDAMPTTLDDNVTQGALRLLMRVDLALDFKDQAIHEAARYALEQLVKAQYPNGAWPQRFREFPDPAKFPVKQARYPADWLRTWPGAQYQQFYTFNDNTVSDAIDLFLEAARIYNEPRYRAVAERGGGFILLAQMPEPQPAWAQQYDLDMQPAWARQFEPPSVTGGESQGIIKTLFVLYRETGDKKYLEPAARALAYLRRSVLPPVERPSEARARLPRGVPVLARFYELKTNKPLYITKGTQINVPGRAAMRVDGYELSYSDESVIRHYAVLIGGADLDAIAAELDYLKSADPAALKRPLKLRGLSPWSTLARSRAAAPASDAQVSRLLSQLDNRGAWVGMGSIGKSGQVVSVFAAKDMVVKIGDRVLPLKENETLEVYEGAERPRERIIRSSTFAENIETLCAWLAETKK
jgi:PelA/Pel-15E family pectate lyase